MAELAALIDRAVALPPGPELSAVLAVLPWEKVPNARLIEVVQARSRQLAHDHAELFAGMVEISHAVALEKLPEKSLGKRAEVVARAEQQFEWAAHEIAAGLTWTPAKSDRELAFGLALRERLPLVFAALQQGRIDVGKARVFVEYLDPADGELTAEQARRLCERFLPLAPGLTTKQLADRLYRALLAIDPELRRRRYERAVQQRGVALYLDPRTGTATLVGNGLPAEEAAAAAQRNDRLVDAVKRAGHPGTRGQISADIYVGMLNGAFHGLTEREIIARVAATRRPEDNHDPATGGDSDCTGTDCAGTATDTATATDADDDTDDDTDTDTDADIDTDADTDDGDDTDEGDGDGALTGAATNGAEPAADTAGSADGDSADGGSADVVDGGAAGRDAGIADAAQGTEDAQAAAPDNTAPDNTAPDNTAPDNTAPDNTAPGSPAPDSPAPGNEAGSADVTGGPGRDRADVSAAGAGEERWAGERVGVREGIEIRAGLGTLAGCDDRPGEIPGLGPVGAHIARAVATRQRRGARWLFALVDPRGYLLLAGPLRRRPHVPGAQAPAVRGGVVEVHLSLEELERYRADPALAAWHGVLAEIAAAWEDRDEVRKRLAANPQARFARGALADHVCVRDRNCIGPGCTCPARRSDLDHTRDHGRGGETVEGNIGPACKSRHPDKDRGWSLSQPEPGLFRWVSPLGAVYWTRGEPVRPDLPDPDPAPADERPGEESAAEVDQRLRRYDPRMLERPITDPSRPPPRVDPPAKPDPPPDDKPPF